MIEMSSFAVFESWSLNETAVSMKFGGFRWLFWIWKGCVFLESWVLKLLGKGKKQIWCFGDDGLFNEFPIVEESWLNTPKNVLLCCDWVSGVVCGDSMDPDWYSILEDFGELGEIVISRLRYIFWHNDSIQKFNQLYWKVGFLKENNDLYLKSKR